MAEQDKEFVYLQSPVGLTYKIQLTKHEIDRVNTDQNFFLEICKKYDELHTNGFISAVDPDSEIDQNENQVNPARPLLGQDDITSENEQYLIPLIEARPLLWDFRIPLKNRGKETIRTLWEEIINELGVNMTVEAIRAKWKNIRDSFIRARNNYRKRIPSGASLEKKLEAEKIRQKHRNYDMLEFLNNCLSERRTSCNLENDLETSVDGPCTSRASTDRESSSGLSRSSDITAADEAFLDTVRHLSRELTANQHFGMQIAHSLDNLPFIIQTQTKIKIMQILAAAEIEHYKK